MDRTLFGAPHEAERAGFCWCERRVSVVQPVYERTPTMYIGLGTLILIIILLILIF